jgi:hypothetical protein
MRINGIWLEHSSLSLVALQFEIDHSGHPRERPSSTFTWRWKKNIKEKRRNVDFLQAVIFQAENTAISEVSMTKIHRLVVSKWTSSTSNSLFFNISEDFADQNFLHFI